MGAMCGNQEKKVVKKEEPVFIVPEPITHNPDPQNSPQIKDNPNAQTDVKNATPNVDNKDQQQSKPQEVKPIQIEEKSILVKLINYYQKNSEEIFSGKVKTAKTFTDLLKEVTSKIEKIKESDLKNYIFFHNIDEHHNEVPYDSDKTLEELFLIPDPNQATKKLITIFCVYSILDIPENIIQAYTKTTLLGKPIADEKNEALSVIINNKKDNSFSIHQYFYENHHYTSNFNEQSAYCNSLDTLYISGGEDNSTGEVLNTFYAVDLKKNIISLLPKLNLERANHSMIFIPNKYIFIVGGNSQKSVELYDIEENELKVDSELNEIRSEASLCCMNNRYLYAFCGYEYSIDFIESFEICDLKKISRKWEKLDFKCQDSLKLEIRFFSITYYDSCDKIIFLGGTLANDTLAEIQYIFDSQENSLEVFKPKEKTQNYLIENHSGERFFIPLKEKDDIITTGLISHVSGCFTMYNHNSKDGVTSLNYNDTSLLDKSIGEDRKQVVNSDEIKLKYLKNYKVVYAAPIKVVHEENDVMEIVVGENQTKENVTENK